MKKLLQAEHGIQHAEEALLLGLIALAAASAVSLFGGSVDARFASVAEEIAAAGS